MSLPLGSPEGEQVPSTPAQHSAPGSSGKPALPSVARGLQILIVRVRFFLVLLAVLPLFGYWPDPCRIYYERMTRGNSRSGDEGGVSRDTEYWCPMCPGVVSDWPSKCPICNMTLVRRKKGEAVPLPDGVLARMQFSPYRVQLAGIRTADVEYRALRATRSCWSGRCNALPQRAPRLRFCAEAFATDLPRSSRSETGD